MPLLTTLIDLALTALSLFNQILTAGVAITTLSLVIYTSTFNLSNRVARAFAGILLAVTLVYATDVVSLLLVEPAWVEVLLRLQWLGLLLLPASFLQFTDGLLETTGQPSRGRRRMAVRAGFLLAVMLFAVAAFTDWLVVDVHITDNYRWMRPGPVFWVWVFGFGAAMLFGLYTIWRAYRRCLTRATRERMGLLLLAAIAPGIGVFPYLMLTGGVIGGDIRVVALIFWFNALFGNIMVGTLLVVMAYSVAFFGAPQPDRVIKARLFGWLLRGPVVTSSALAAMVVTGRVARQYGLPDNLLTPIVFIAVLLNLQFVITVFRRPLERLLFSGSRDRDAIERLDMLGERLLSAGDVEEFLESVLAAACDAMRVPSGFIASVGSEAARFEVRIGPDEPPQSQLSDLGEISRDDVRMEAKSEVPQLFEWQGFWLLPLHARSAELAEQGQIVGLMGLKAADDRPLTAPNDPEDLRALHLLAEHAATALEDRRLQRKVFAALDSLLPQVDRVQRMRAAARYEATAALTRSQELVEDPDLSRWVKQALSHYWGGPRLAESPLLGLQIVAQAQANAANDNPVNALRSVLRDAIEQVKPSDEPRRFTTEWILYNILEMKFVENRRVRDIALRLSMSEADLYRKQRIAVDQVARIISEMEREAVDEVRNGYRQRSTDADSAA